MWVLHTVFKAYHSISKTACTHINNNIRKTKYSVLFCFLNKPISIIFKNLHIIFFRVLMKSDSKVDIIN